MWLFHILGLDDASGPWYLFWSGFGANFGEFALLTGVVAFWRKHKCHTRGCWRFARHPHLVDGVVLQLCTKHHPGGT